MSQTILHADGTPYRFQPGDRVRAVWDNATHGFDRVWENALVHHIDLNDATLTYMIWEDVDQTATPEDEECEGGEQWCTEGQLILQATDTDSTQTSTDPLRDLQTVTLALVEGIGDGSITLHDIKRKANHALDLTTVLRHRKQREAVAKGLCSACMTRVTFEPDGTWLHGDTPTDEHQPPAVILGA